jgi:hypothetical protein
MDPNWLIPTCRKLDGGGDIVRNVYKATVMAHPSGRETGPTSNNNNKRKTLFRY